MTTEQKTKILVTGGAGYIGSVLVPELLKKGHEVTVIARLRDGSASLLDYTGDNKLKAIRGDTRDKDLVSKCLEETDVIIPLASLAGAPLCDKDPVSAKAINLDAITMLLELRRKDQKIIFLTTNIGYGVEQNEIYCTEDSPLNPISLYGQLKVEAEKRVLESGNNVSLRLASAFGVSPRMRWDLLVNDFTYKAVKDKFLDLFESSFKRNFIHIRDVVKACIHCLEHWDTMQNEAYNLGLSNANLTKWELCEEIRKQVPDFNFVNSGTGKDPDKRNYIVSNEKIEATGFRPDYSLAQGIGELMPVIVNLESK